MPGKICPVCKDTLSQGLQSWHFICRKCKYENSNFNERINLQSAHGLIDEGARETGLKELRADNFNRLLTRIKELKPEGGRLLDVGCAHGWFLETAERDFDVLGIEPDEVVFNSTARKGLPVRKGYFPDVLEEYEKFDVIIFNDVIEHIPDIEAALASCRSHLNEGGLLVLNLPSRDGIFYRLSKLLAQVGFVGFFERLWQKGLPSPHLHYFNIENLVRLLEDHGFESKTRGGLNAVGLSGLYTRVSYTGNYGYLTRIALCCGIVLLIPMLSILPRDIIYVMSRRK
jgi:2-polyprenyl-3-methyl-5-hydroxy-6-metoxy-1,4-benzoquinol methylase